eukprot:TRINITY_DN25040_c0_g1_i5.p1 TRINITY_DN25040_c0_g1~~TRINITY_DN25040_c0_g1_i5.p1  ORF type:complete len:341 (+),score=84.95 TRINITY_DN25040_c0_g1_i5:97-1119(+)
MYADREEARRGPPKWEPGPGARRGGRPAGGKAEGEPPIGGSALRSEPYPQPVRAAPGPPHAGPQHAASPHDPSAAVRSVLTSVLQKAAAEQRRRPAPPALRRRDAEAEDCAAAGGGGEFAAAGDGWQRRSRPPLVFVREEDERPGGMRSDRGPPVVLRPAPGRAVGVGPVGGLQKKVFLKGGRKLFRGGPGSNSATVLQQALVSQRRQDALARRSHLGGLQEGPRVPSASAAARAEEAVGDAGEDSEESEATESSDESECSGAEESEEEQPRRPQRRQPSDSASASSAEPQRLRAAEIASLQARCRMLEQEVKAQRRRRDQLATSQSRGLAARRVVRSAR